MDRLPDLLRIGREDAGISRRELARRAGLDPMYVSRLERGLVRVADWRKISAIAAQIPLSELAKLTRVSGAGKLKHSALALAGDLEKLLASLPETDLEDEEWVSALQTRLLKCMMVAKMHDWGTPKTELSVNCGNREDAKGIHRVQRHSLGADRWQGT
jgi:transcriptional regulator with XRE-family HTH domain